MSNTTYEKTRQAWRDIWIGTEFDRELKTLEYAHTSELLRAYTPYLDKNKPVLEAGCGPAHIVYYFRERGYNVIGLDYAPEAITPTIKRFPELPLQVGDVHALPYRSNSFGAYLSFGVVEHFEHGPEPALREAYRVLAPEGVLVLTVPHPQFVESLYSLRNKLRSPSDQPRAGYYEVTYTHQQLAKHVENVGFKIEKIQPIYHSYTFYGLHSMFRQQGSYYEPSALAEKIGSLFKTILPWQTAFSTLIIARK